MRARLLLFALCPVGLSAQTVLFTEDFEGPQPAFALNTTDVGSLASGTNTWLVNDVYAGGTGDVICSGFSLSFTVPSTPGQPGGIVPANGNYLHTAATEAVADGILCCSFAAADGFCTAAGNHFARMTQDVSTVGLAGTAFSFWWLCNGGTSIYGEVYYSTNGGSSWNLITTPIAQYRNQPTWTQQSISLPAFDGQSTLRFGFRFVNATSLLGGQDPGFGIDDIRIEAQPTVNALLTLSLPGQLCTGQAINVGYDAQGSYQPGNTFTAELSDANGSFASPVAIGSVVSTTSGSVPCTLPPGTPAGNGYRVRVVSDLPVVTGSDNGLDIAIAPAPNAGLSTTITVCDNTASFPLFAQLGGTPDAGGTWTDPFANPHPGSFVPQSSMPGCYTYAVAAVGACPGATAQVCVGLSQSVNAGLDFNDTVCTDDATVVLFDLLGGTPDNGGFWTIPGGSPHSGLFQVNVDPLGCYFYTVPGVPPCSDDVAVVCIQAVIPEPDAGLDSTITLCVNDPPYDLFQALGGTPQPGGTWMDQQSTGALNGAFVAPSVLMPGSYDFDYTMPGGGGCAPDMATVTVTIDPCLGIGEGTSREALGAWTGQAEDGSHGFLIPMITGERPDLLVTDLHGRRVAGWRVVGSAPGSLKLMLEASPGIYLLQVEGQAGAAMRFVHAPR